MLWKQLRGVRAAGARPSIAFFEAALPLAMHQLHKYSGQSLANVASSFLAVQIGATSGLFEAVSREIMTRAESLENSALLLLLKTLPQAPHSPSVHGAVWRLFVEVARRIDMLPSRELQVLSHICANCVNGGRITDNREELRIGCMSLATRWQSDPVVPSTAEPAASVAVSTEAKNDAAGAEEMAQWVPPVILTVANTGRPAGAWDEKAMQHMREGMEEAARERGLAGVDGPIDSQGNQSHFVFSIKNTFLDDCSANCSISEIPHIPLPPALPFIPGSISAEKLHEYRSNYARFRVGNAIGAKGEVDTCHDFEDVAEETDDATVGEEMARWVPPITLTIANTGRPASAWDEMAMQQMREVMQVAAQERGSSDADDPAFSERASHGDGISQQPNLVFSVKNTFLDVDDGNHHGDEDSDCEILHIPLPPALSFMPGSISAEKLQIFRANYARFRVGNAVGAKGEVGVCHE